MFKEIFKDLIGRIQPRGDRLIPVFEHEGYKGIPVEEKNFSDIPETHFKGTILFIDGGNNTILASFNFSLQYVRVVGVEYKDGKRSALHRNECYSLTTTRYDHGKIIYHSRFYPVKERLLNDLEFDSMDEDLKDGSFRAGVAKVAAIGRRLSEIKLAYELIKKLKRDDLIILDGSLMAATEVERIMLDDLYKEATEKGVVVAALTKTTRIFTSSGASLADTLSTFEKQGRWTYYPVFRISNPSHRAEMYFVKLHRRSDYTFRFEIHERQKAMDVISALAQNSCDAAFLGYPYGLITADRFARVTNNEAEYLKTRFMTEAGKEINLIEKSMRTINSHDRLGGI